MSGIDRSAWAQLNAEKRRLLRPTGLSIEEKLRRGQRLSAQAAALRRGIIRDEPPVSLKRLAGRPRDKADLDELREIHGELPIDPLPGVDS